MIAQEIVMNMSHEITPEQITPRFLASLIRWQKQGNRAVDIKIPPLWIHEEGAVTTVWCYDHDLKEGNYATRISEIPTTKSLMRQRQKRVEEEKYDLTRKLKELEAMA
jgi:hypothetical protein